MSGLSPSSFPLDTPPLISHQTARSRVKVTCVLLAKRAPFNTRGSRQRRGPSGLDSLKCCLSFCVLWFPGWRLCRLGWTIKGSPDGTGRSSESHRLKMPGFGGAAHSHHLLARSVWPLLVIIWVLINRPKLRHRRFLLALTLDRTSPHFPLNKSVVCGRSLARL